MKKTILILTSVALILNACNQADQKHNANDDAHMNHETSKAENVMMQAMDNSMIAMHNAKMTGNADYDFASMMIPHHEGAVVMAEAQVKNGKSVALNSFSKNVIVEQKKEIAMLNEFLKNAKQQPTKDATKFKTALDAAMMPMMDGMGNIKLTNDIDQDFVALMIPHHQSAVDMAKAYLPYANNEKIKLLAQQIVQAQEDEIKWLKTQ